MAAIGPASPRLMSTARNHALLPGWRRIVVGSTEMKSPDANRFTLMWIEIVVTMERGFERKIIRGGFRIPSGQHNIEFTVTQLAEHCRRITDRDLIGDPGIFRK